MLCYVTNMAGTKLEISRHVAAQVFYFKEYIDVLNDGLSSTGVPKILNVPSHVGYRKHSIPKPKVFYRATRVHSAN